MGIKQGIEKGRQEGKCDAARIMKTEGFDYSMIARMTGLTREEIEKL